MSLQEQLLKSGLVNQQKLKQAKAEKRKQTKKQQKNKVSVSNEAQKLAQEAKAKQIEKDKKLNEQRNQEAIKKQIASQVAQLIDVNKLPQDSDGEAYHFTDGQTVKQIYVSQEIRSKIISGRLAIVKSASGYEVVASEVAEKIKQRDEKTVIVLFDGKDSGAGDEEDIYKGYEIPDDLIW